jgi:hypothetical protein
MENEPIHTLEFTESQLFELYDLLDFEVDEWVEKIDNPCEELAKYTTRKDRVMIVDETMGLFEVVKAKIDEIFAEEEQ